MGDCDVRAMEELMCMPNCWRCGGAGSYPVAIITGNDEWTTVQKDCPDCSADAEDEITARPAPAGSEEDAR